MKRARKTVRLCDGDAIAVAEAEKRNRIEIELQSQGFWDEMSATPRQVDNLIAALVLVRDAVRRKAR
jgi:hypothetical protein